MADSTTLTGNVSRAPELRFMPTGTKTVKFGLAVNRRWQNRQTQEWEESASFFDVICWREMAENVAESLAVGTRVIVTGRFETRSWETENGEKRSRIELNAEEIAPSLRYATVEVTKNPRRDGTTPTPPRQRPASASRPQSTVGSQAECTVTPSCALPAGHDGICEPF